MTTPATAADELRDWLAWARERLAGVPEPSIVDRIRQQERERIRAALLAVSDLRGSAYRRVLAILDAPEAQK